MQTNALEIDVVKVEKNKLGFSCNWMVMVGRNMGGKVVPGEGKSSKLWLVVETWMDGGKRNELVSHFGLEIFPDLTE